MRLAKYVLPLMLSACAIDPSAVNDYSGLGKSPLAITLRNSIFLGESAVNHSVDRLIKEQNIPKDDRAKNGLTSLGFKCLDEDKNYCEYVGSTKSVLRDGLITQRKPILRNNVEPSAMKIIASDTSRRCS